MDGSMGRAVRGRTLSLYALKDLGIYMTIIRYVNRSENKSVLV